jgi:hypothetical protein
METTRARVCVFGTRGASQLSATPWTGEEDVAQSVLEAKVKVTVGNGFGRKPSKRRPRGGKGSTGLQSMEQEQEQPTETEPAPAPALEQRMVPGPNPVRERQSFADPDVSVPPPPSTSLACQRLFGPEVGETHWCCALVAVT